MHNFRDALQFKGQRLLVVGASYSAEDMILQNIKYGAKKVICSYRSAPLPYGNWPEGVEHKPLITKIDGKMVTFKDGSTAEVKPMLS